MPYQLPAGLQLNDTVYHLSRDYKGNHQSLVDTIQSFRECRVQVVLGACIYGLESIFAEYYLVSRCRNSQIYRRLENGLNISDQNPLMDYERLVYLEFFYQHVKSNDPSEKNKLLIRDIERIVGNVIGRLWLLDIPLLMKRQPAKKVLYKNVEKVSEDYKKCLVARKDSYYSWATSFFSAPNPEHDRFCRFISILHHECKMEEKKEEEWSVNYTIRCGALLYVMSQIEEEYGVRSAKNSDLYKICRNTLNIKNVKEVLDEPRSIYYADLNAFVSRILASPSLLEKWKAKGLNQPKEFFEKMGENISVKKVQKNSFVMGSLEMLGGCATFYGVNMVVGEAASILMNKLTLDGVIAGAVELSKFMHPEYVVVGTFIGFLMKDKLKTKVSAVISEKINTIIITSLESTVIFTYGSFSSFIEFCKRSIFADQSLQASYSKNDLNWVTTLLRLPDHLFSNKDKEKIRNIIDIEEPVVSEEEALYDPFQAMRLA